MEKKNINFKEITVMDIEGNKCQVDISKELGNMIYQKTVDLGELELAQKIYREGIVEINQDVAEMINKYVREGFVAFVQKAVNEEIGGII